MLYEVKTGYQNVFGEWTGENVGLPMAIVLNEVYRSAPVINSQLSDNVQITLGRAPTPSSRRRPRSSPRCSRPAR